MRLWISVVLLAHMWLGDVEAKCLVREPPDTSAAPHNSDLGFYLSVNGNPKSYEPGQLYTVSLKGDTTQFVQKQFVEFLLVVENANEERVGPKAGRTGSFQLLGDVLTRFSDHCINTVTQTSGVAKPEIQVLWTAPPARSGCVTLKATVVESQDVWSMDTGRLSLQLCEAKVAEHSKPDTIVDPCCACEEAKYEVIFEGLWSEKTHPKNFPASRWLLHFSDIIGASHSTRYRVWEYGGFASKGLAQVAKWGSTRALEGELKAESQHIRTIIKARGLWYPNVNGKTFAVFRTDRRNHLVSLVSMLGPSPDWIVGVSGLELCNTNCTWADRKELFLYPWDTGVDSGISYESPDLPTEPQQPITRITSRLPDDPRQPFWNEAGSPMKPLAKLTVNRQRLYRKSCGEEDEQPQTLTDLYEDNQDAVFEDQTLPDCESSAWSAWSDCSVTCGKGISMRTRSFLMPDKAKMLGCDRQLMQKEMCSAVIPVCEGEGFYESAPQDFLPDDMCATSEWSTWSSCSTTCGKGFESRARRFFNRMGRKKCPHVETMEKRMCAGLEAVCAVDRFEDPDCAVTSWSDWSPCSVSCGKGLKVRTRLYMVSPQQQSSSQCKTQLMEKSQCEGVRPTCEFDHEDARFVCSLKKMEGPCRGHFSRWYYDTKKKDCLQFVYGGCRGNSNNFEFYEECQKVCQVKAQMNAFEEEQEAASSAEEGIMMTKKMPGAFQLDHDQSWAQKKAMMLKSAMMKNDTGHGEDEYDEDDEKDNDNGDDDDDDDDDDASDEHEEDVGDHMPQKVGMSHLKSLEHVPIVGETKEARKIRLMDEERKRQIMRVMMDPKKESMDSTTLHPPVDCLMTPWSQWSPCSATCGEAFRKKFRMIKRHHTPGGRACPERLEKRQKCQRLPECHASGCHLGEWSEWSACSQTCGSDAAQQRLRLPVLDDAAAAEAHNCGAPTMEKRMCQLVECPDAPSGR